MEDEYCDEHIVTENISSLGQDELMQLLNEVLGVLNLDVNKAVKKIAIDRIKHHTNLVSPEQSKILNDLKIKNNTLMFPLGGFGYENLEVGKDDINNYTIKKIIDWQKDNVDCYIRVEVPQYIQDKIDAYKAKLANERKTKDRRKKEKEVEKARKILANAGEQV
jgi:hypothetical protein